MRNKWVIMPKALRIYCLFNSSHLGITRKKKLFLVRGQTAPCLAYGGSVGHFSLKINLHSFPTKNLLLSVNIPRF